MAESQRAQPARSRPVNEFRASSRFWDGFHSSQQKNISRNTDEKNRRRRDESPRERMRSLHHVTCNDGRSDRRNLIAEIQNSAHRADAFFRSNQRRNRPANRRSRRQSSDRNADPDQRTRCTLCLRSSEYPEPQAGPPDKYRLTNAHRVPPPLDQGIHEPSAYRQIRRRSK